jgi:hypothetical protein
MYLLATILLLLTSWFSLVAEDLSRQTLKFGDISFSGMIDTYVGHDFNNPRTLDRAYTTQVVHEDQLAINLALADVKITKDNFHARLAIQDGTSVEVNYAAEEHLAFRYLHEAYVGFKINDQLWLDAGIYTSHFGFENFVSQDNWNYTRSLVAEYLPYYESGVKLTYQVNQSDTLQFHLLRGWQNISSKEDPALGFQYVHKFDDQFKFTYANFTGDVEGLRSFNDFILTYDFSEKFKLAFQYDLGRQEDNRSNNISWWHGTSLMTRYIFNKKLAISTRLESFYDPEHAVLETLNSAKFNVFGFSVNLDYEIYPKIFWRNEYRMFSGKEAVYPTQDGFSKSDSFIVTALIYTFN